MLIGEVARRSGVSARMLRHYDSLGLVRPTGRSGAGYREYSGEDIRRIFHVESLRSLGLSLREVGQALDDPGFAPSALVDDLVHRTRDRIARETELLTRLRRIGAAEPGGWQDVLQVVALLQALGSESPGTRQRAALSSSDEVPVPVEALVEAVLTESDPNVAGALRWALARSDGGGALLAEGLGSPVAEVRLRAVRSLTEIPDDEATALLRDALAHPDMAVRGYAALALGARGRPTRSRRSSPWSPRGPTTSRRPTRWARWRAVPGRRTGSPPGSSTASRTRAPDRPRVGGWRRRSRTSREPRRPVPWWNCRTTRTARSRSPPRTSCGSATLEDGSFPGTACGVPRPRRRGNGGRATAARRTASGGARRAPDGVRRCPRTAARPFAYLVRARTKPPRTSRIGLERESSLTAFLGT